MGGMACGATHTKNEESPSTLSNGTQAGCAPLNCLGVSLFEYSNNLGDECLSEM